MLQIEKVDAGKVTFAGSPVEEYIDTRLITGKLVVREWQKGDKFIPLGMKGFKKVSDFLTDKKIPVRERKGQVSPL